MTIQTQLSEQEFIQVSLVLLYKKTATKILTIIGAVFLIVILLPLAFEPATFDAGNLITPLIILVFLPLRVYFSAKNTYKNNHQVREKTIYHLTNDQLLIEGETYNTTFVWSNISKVTQTKNWLLIWQNANKSYPISTRDVWAGQIAEIKDILESNKVKNNLTYLP